MHKIMEFKRVRKLKIIAARKIYYYALNLAYIFHFSSWYYCSCKKFQVCVDFYGEELYCFIFRFKMEYNPRDIEEISDSKKIEDVYLAMKKDIKRCIQFDPSIDNFWLYHFKINCYGYEGKRSCYLKESIL